MPNSFGSNLGSIFESYGQLCIGIDPQSEALENFGAADSVVGIERFSLAVIEAVAGRVGIVKPQVAFFERFGSKGFAVLERICSTAKSAGLMVIADAKRGDIGSTMAGYMKAWLSSDAPFLADALTLSPYLGAQTFIETYEMALINGKGIFVLAATSNIEGQVIQLASRNHVTVAQQVAEEVQKIAIPEGGKLKSAGLVIGATINLDDYGFTKQELEGLPILAPGFGAQGAKLTELKHIFGQYSENVIVNVGRSVYGSDVADIARKIEIAKEQLNEAISR